MDCEDGFSTKILRHAHKKPQPEGVVVCLSAFRLRQSTGLPLCSDDAVYEDGSFVSGQEMPAPARAAPIKEPGLWLPALIAFLSCGSIIGIYWALLAMIKTVVLFPG
ncbi:hypothetical protein J2858_004516 [Neorhizobium galegae]|uniref:hypothetical protein n=1 Tax=Neorhizobium galegae TaxID=399 RepID=UPI001AE91AF5|nr:hypothetical protein [Neorhizobium galegae]MBP2551574.1 hypothetical protein [Neorhizobium galegae]